MSDFYITLVSEKLNSTDSKKAAIKIIEFLTQQEIIEKKVTDCVLGFSYGYLPGRNYQEILKNTEFDLTKLKVNGVEFITEKKVFDSGRNELEHVICSGCKENNIENNWSDSLNNWILGTESNKLKCQNCGIINPITQYEFTPTWAFGNFGITFWNWSEFKPSFISELEKRIGGKLKIIYGKI